MKTSIMIVSLGIASLCMSFDTPTAIDNKPAVETAQSNSFDFVRLHRQGKGVTATWAFTAPEDVVSFVVQRTYEDPSDPYANWENLCSVPCNPARSYKYNDKEVFPGMIHYRIVASTSNGQEIQSEVSGIRIRSHQ